MRKYKMLKYDLTGEQSQPGEKQKKFVSKYREVTYIRFCLKKKERVEVVGRETVEEITVPPRIETINAVCVGFKTIDTSEKDYEIFKKKQRFQKDNRE